VQPAAAHEIAPLKAGDGVVFDAADWRSPQEDEEGGRVYHVTPQLDGTLDLSFANNAVNFQRIRAGDLVWRTHDPEVDRAARPFLDPVAPVSKQPLTVHATAGVNQPLHTRWTLPSGLSVIVESPTTLSAAQNRGLTEATLIEQFSRLGNTPYELAGLSAEIAGSVFVPASMLNRMRREAVEKLEDLQSHPQSARFIPRPFFGAKSDRQGRVPHNSTCWFETGSSLKPPSRPNPIASLWTIWICTGCALPSSAVKAAGVQVRVASHAY